MNNDEITLPALGGDAHLTDAHLTFEELERYVDGSADAIDRELVEAHAADCEPCRSELADLERVHAATNDATKVAPIRAPRRAAWWVAAAAILAVLVTGAWLWFQPSDGSQTPVARTPAPPPEQPHPPRAVETPQSAAVTLTEPAIVATLVRGGGVLRGSEKEPAFALQGPVGTVVLEDRPRFRWSAASGVTRYTVSVADVEDGSVAATGSTSAESWTPAKPLRRGHTYTWQVTAHRPGASLIAPPTSAGEALFHVANREDADALASLQGGPLARGVALAERGVLDDAERELRLAAEAGEEHAAALLAQVRSWRQRALPTTTNGAQ